MRAADYGFFIKMQGGARNAQRGADSANAGLFPAVRPAGAGTGKATWIHVPIIARFFVTYKIESFSAMLYWS